MRFVSEIYIRSHPPPPPPPPQSPPSPPSPPSPGDEILSGTEANNGDDLQGLAAGNYVVRSPQIINSCIFASSLFYIIGGFLILGHDVDKYDPSSSQLWDQVALKVMKCNDDDDSDIIFVATGATGGCVNFLLTA